jgi:multidrug efflux pump subunit AcrA (membrane-fusion protein)
MSFSQYLKPVIAVGAAVGMVGGDYLWEHRSRPQEKEGQSNARVVVTKAGNAYFSDLVRVTGFVVARREAVVGPDQEGSKVDSLYVREGDMVTENQELARLSAPPQQPGPPGQQSKSGPISLKAPAAGLITEVRTAVGAPASPQAGPMFRIAVGNEVEVDAEVPSGSMMKLAPGATVRIIRDNQPEISGRVRMISPEVVRATQLGHVRIALNSNSGLKIGSFVRASIDTKRSYGVAIPRTAIDHLTVQIVKGNTVETRKVRVGLTDGNAIEILEGLDVGEIVVKDAGSSLHEGDQIKTTDASEDIDQTRGR